MDVVKRSTVMEEGVEEAIKQRWWDDEITEDVSSSSLSRQKNIKVQLETYLE